MRRLLVFPVVVVVLAFTASLSADVRTDQRVKFQLGGALGKMVNMFGGKGAREGVTTVVAVKGNRKATMSDTNGQIIDLTEEKIYNLDIKNPHTVADDHGNPETLLTALNKAEAQTASLRIQLKAILAEALLR